MSVSRPESGPIVDYRLEEECSPQLGEFLLANGALAERHCPQCGHRQPGETGQVEADSYKRQTPCRACNFEIMEQVYVLPAGARFSFTEPQTDHSQSDHSQGDASDHEVIMGGAFEQNPQQGDEANRAKAGIPFIRDDIGQVVKGLAHQGFQKLRSIIRQVIAPKLRGNTDE